MSPGRGLRIAFVGDDRPGCTSRHRADALRRCGFHVSRIDAAAQLQGVRRVLQAFTVRVGYHLDLVEVSRKLEVATDGQDFDVVWLDKALSVRPATIRAIKARRASVKTILYHPDDFRARFNWSRSLSRDPDVIDLVVTTKSYNVPEYESLGFRNVLFVNNSFDPVEHVPPECPEPEARRYEFDIGFIGGYERERADAIVELAERGLTVHVAGSFWDHHMAHVPRVLMSHGDLVGRAYAERIYRTRINLAFLRKQNRDLQTTRSFEIPACGGFMLSERTKELLAIFQEGEDAAFFSNVDELYRKCVEYLGREQERERIAERGFGLMMRGGFSSDSVVSSAIERVLRT